MIVDIAPTNSAENNHETSASDTKSDPTSVIWLGWADITRDLGIVQTLATFAVEGDITITEDVINELIHCGLFEPTSCTSPAAESSGTFDFLGQEVADVYRQSAIRRKWYGIELTNATIFAANKPSGNTAAFDVVTRIRGHVVVVANSPGRFTSVKCAVERLYLSCPELEVARRIVTITREGNLWGSTRKHVQNFAVYKDRLG